MIDYVELFSKILKEENGDQKLSDYLDAIADSATTALERRNAEVQKEKVIQELAAVIKKHYGNFKIFTWGNYTPVDAMTATVECLLDMEQAVDEDEDLANWLRSDR